MHGSIYSGERLDATESLVDSTPGFLLDYVKESARAKISTLSLRLRSIAHRCTRSPDVIGHFKTEPPFLRASSRRQKVYDFTFRACVVSAICSLARADDTLEHLSEAAKALKPLEINWEPSNPPTLWIPLYHRGHGIQGGGS
jgi:hypothetical protein